MKSLDEIREALWNLLLSCPPGDRQTRLRNAYMHVALIYVEELERAVEIR